MARSKSKREYLAALDALRPPIKTAFLRWSAGRVDLANVSAIERFVAQDNVEAIMASMDISGTSQSDITETVRGAYKSGGEFEAPEARITFDINSSESAAIIASEAASLTTAITSSQREGIQTAISSGLRTGTNPRTTALDIVGRRTRGGVRKGGIVGLSGQQSEWVTSSRAELRASDPASLKSYLKRKRRNKRYDSQVRKAINSGKPLTVAQVNKITGAYADRLLILRGETIARTESISAMNAGRDAAWDQSVREGKVSRDFITASWSSTGDARTRDAHQAMNGQVRQHGEPFNSPTGALMLHPGDTSYGARGGDVVNCRCFKQNRADFIAQFAAGF